MQMGGMAEEVELLSVIQQHHKGHTKLYQSLWSVVLVVNDHMCVETWWVFSLLRDM